MMVEVVGLAMAVELLFALVPWRYVTSTSSVRLAEWGCEW